MANSSTQFKLPTIAKDNHLPYNVHDYYSAYEWLKQKAIALSNNQWSDFTEGSIGAVQLHLLSYLTDMIHFHVDKQTAELYLSTAVERSSLLTMAEMMSYYPRHYLSGSTKLILTSQNADMYGLVIPAYQKFYSTEHTVSFHSIKPYKCLSDNYLEVEVFEGEYNNVRFYLEDIDDLGRIYLKQFNIGFNTVTLNIDNIDIEKSENALYSKQPYTFSIHCSPEHKVYIQLPPIWRDVINPTSQIYVSYLTTSGILSNIGAGVIDRVYSIPGSTSDIEVLQEDPVINGRDPQTVDELKVSLPEQAKTMDTFITLADYSSRILEHVIDIVDILALDYTIKDSGLVQPTPPNGAINDAFKVKIIAKPLVGSIYLGSYDNVSNLTVEDNRMLMIPGDTFTLEGINQVFTVTEADREGKMIDYSPHEFKTNDDVTGVHKIIPTHRSLDTSNNLMKLTIVNGGQDYFVGDNLLLHLPGIAESRFNIEVTAVDSDGAVTEFANCGLLSIALAPGTYTYEPIDGTGTNLVVKAEVTAYPENPIETEVEVTSTIIPQNERVFSTIGEELDNYVQAHRPAGTYIIYEEAEMIVPDIVIDLYLDEASENFAIIDNMVENYIKKLYSTQVKTPERSINNRPDFHIGSPLYATVLSQQIIDEFEEIEYAICRMPEEKLVPNLTQYIDMENANYTIRKNYQP